MCSKSQLLFFLETLSSSIHPTELLRGWRWKISWSSLKIPNRQSKPCTFLEPTSILGEDLGKYGSGCCLSLSPSHMERGHQAVDRRLSQPNLSSEDSPVIAAGVLLCFKALSSSSTRLGRWGWREQNWLQETQVINIWHTGHQFYSIGSLF